VIRFPLVTATAQAAPEQVEEDVMQKNFLRRRGARGLALALLAAVGLAGATPAFAYWHHGGYHHDHWHGGGGVWVGPGYPAPPVVYGPAPVYAPPPVVYSPGVSFGIHIR
jgi:hypothetical protein